MKIKLFLLVLLICSFITQANEQPKNFAKLIDTLVSCDASFFNAIAMNKEELFPYVDVKSIDDNNAYIEVENRAKSDKNFRLFNTPINYKSLSIIGYYDSALNLNKHGNYYFWGFIIDNEINQIKDVLNSVKWRSMEDDSLYIANPQIWSTGDSSITWHENNQVVVGVKTMPAQNTAEKLLLLERSANSVLLVCSIQGFLPAELIELERPDLKN